MRRAWLAVSAISTGFGVWATHFIAMLAFSPGVPTAYNKIDGSFIKSVESGGQAAAIVRSVLGLGRGLNLPVLAEGVETGAELGFLEGELCDEAQRLPAGKACEHRELP
jgi:predicted signal transduction protein with EAL and GGDEF domain